MKVIKRRPMPFVMAYFLLVAFDEEDTFGDESPNHPLLDVEDMVEWRSLTKQIPSIFA